MTSKRNKPDDWNFKLNEVDAPEGEMCTIDIDEWLADNALEIYHRLEATGEQAIAPTPAINGMSEQLSSTAKKDLGIGLIPALAKINNQPLKSKGETITGEWGQKKTFSHILLIGQLFLENKLPKVNLGVQPC